MIITIYIKRVSAELRLYFHPNETLFISPHLMQHLSQSSQGNPFSRYSHIGGPIILDIEIDFEASRRLKNTSRCLSTYQLIFMTRGYIQVVSGIPTDPRSNQSLKILCAS